MREPKLPGNAAALARGALCALAIGSLACRPAPQESEDARNLVLVTVDTWRGDHFGTSVAGQELTPNLTRFAASGVRFTAAHSAGNETSPGIAGVLTGLTPRRSGVMINLHVLQGEVPSLGPLLSGVGFASAGIVANPVLRPGTGFGLGFDSYEFVPGGSEPYAKAPAETVTDAALTRLDDLAKAERFFLWVHFMDPHGPYLPPDRWLDRFPREHFGAERKIPLLPPGDHSGLGGVPAYQQLGLDPVPTDSRSYLARYGAGVRYLDQEAGRFLAELRRRGHLEDTLVVLTADHGEALDGDHGYYFSHGNGLTQDQIHVPLVLTGPGVPAGRIVPRAVSTLGIAPTVLDLLGIAPPEGHHFDGAQLLSNTDGPVHSASGRETALRLANWKAIWERQGKPRLYDLSRDSSETRNLVSEHPQRLEELTRLLRRSRSRPAFTEPTRRTDLPPEERDALRALGYL